jgi:calcineurin-like phosphoesterase family protein
MARRPYLQNVTSTSASILLTTVEPNMDVPIRLLGADRTTRELPTELDAADGTGHQRRARFDGLQPATKYCYQVGDWAKTVAFNTAPPSGAGARVRFVAFGDSGGDSRESVRREMERVPFDLMLHVGDIAYERGEVAEFESKFFATYGNLIARLPIFPASGNHEYITADAAPYREVFELPGNGGQHGVERWFSFDWGDIHFVALDTERVGPEQAVWLERDLGRTALRWRVAYMHKPPYSSGVHGSSLTVREAFAHVFERFGVQLVLSGHDHDYERTEPIGGVTYIVTGGGGKSLRPVGSSDFTAHSESTFHFVHGTLQGETLWIRAIDTSGELIDAARLSR